MGAIKEQAECEHREYKVSCAIRLQNMTSMSLFLSEFSSQNIVKAYAVKEN